MSCSKRSLIRGLSEIRAVTYFAAFAIALPGAAFGQAAATSQPGAATPPKVVRVTPPSVSFGRLLGESIETRVVTIANLGKGGLRVTMHPPEKAAFGYELVETNPGMEYQLFITASGPMAPGVVRETVKMETGLAEQPWVELMAAAYIPEPIEISPTVVMLPSLADQKTATRKVVQITNRGPDGLTVTTATCDDPKIKVALQKPIPDRLYRIVLEFPAGYSMPQQGHIVTVQADAPRPRSFQIPIRPAGGSAQPSGAAGNKTAAAPQRPAMELANKPAPRFELETTVVGRAISNAEIGMAPVTVLNFVAPNCGFCKRQIPKVESVRSRFESMGVRFINVSETMRKAFTQSEAEAVYDTVGSRLELAMDPGNRVGGMFKVSSFPTMFVVTNDGIVRHVNIGAKANIDEMLATQLGHLLDGHHLGAGSGESSDGQATTSGPSEKKTGA